MRNSDERVRHDGVNYVQALQCPQCLMVICMMSQTEGAKQCQRSGGDGAKDPAQWWLGVCRQSSKLGAESRRQGSSLNLRREMRNAKLKVPSAKRFA